MFRPFTSRCECRWSVRTFSKRANIRLEIVENVLSKFCSQLYRSLVDRKGLAYFQVSRLRISLIFFWHTKHSNSSPLRHSFGIGGTRRWPDLGAFVARDDRTELKESGRRSLAPGLMYSFVSETSWTLASALSNMASAMSNIEGPDKVDLVVCVYLPKEIEDSLLWEPTSQSFPGLDQVSYQDPRGHRSAK